MVTVTVPGPVPLVGEILLVCPTNSFKSTKAYQLSPAGAKTWKVPEICPPPHPPTEPSGRVVVLTPSPEEEAGLKFAVTAWSVLMVTWQALPEQAPLNPLKLDPVADSLSR